MVSQRQLLLSFIHVKLKKGKFIIFLTVSYTCQKQSVSQTSKYPCFKITNQPPTYIVYCFTIQKLKQLYRFNFDLQTSELFTVCNNMYTGYMYVNHFTVGLSLSGISLNYMYITVVFWNTVNQLLFPCIIRNTK